MSTEDRSRYLPARRALADEVYDAVLGLLMDQVIEPGSRASIDGIARQLDVSPTPVREALARLESEGLVIKKALKGYTAAPLLDAEGLRQLFEMRGLLEPAAARLATPRLPQDALEELQRIFDAMHARGESERSADERYQDYRDFAERDAQFHALIARHAGNDLLSDAILRLRSHMHIYRLYFTHGLTKETSDEHEAVLVAIQNGDGDAAATAMLAHIERSYARMAASISEPAPDAS
ncbi:DNA-binding GntR family transcriptional regulator [Diaminobutyricimonas aerilata]|uniref:DNA-binding GntR family transcriptional regulator n=1 Tax=Diaminobutyricimonas aerilata TaxID=1162967 RepID=A0A2M9CN55_9MICO|nr:GntR family transcriptional regulator [Diaminobutyricimonas aerilata]PJJ73339.1 DNA-binding GntR family transcriptional regulator [Diaminobutyricimonas aerilata]